MLLGIAGENNLAAGLILAWAICPFLRLHGSICGAGKNLSESGIFPQKSHEAITASCLFLVVNPKRRQARRMRADSEHDASSFGQQRAALSDGADRRNRPAYAPRPRTTHRPLDGRPALL